VAQYFSLITELVHAARPVAIVFLGLIAGNDFVPRGRSTVPVGVGSQLGVGFGLVTVAALRNFSFEPRKNRFEESILDQSQHSFPSACLR
jgi:hypothetical protein